MERIVAFLLGFIFAGLIGWIASSILKEHRNDDTNKVILATFFEITFRLSVLMLLLFALFISIRILTFFLLDSTINVSEVVGTIIFDLLPRWLLDFLYGILSGIIFAAVIGMLSQQITINWKKICALIRFSLNPPPDRGSMKGSVETTESTTSIHTQDKETVVKQLRDELTEFDLWEGNGTESPKEVDSGTMLEAESQQQQINSLRRQLAQHCTNRNKLQEDAAIYGAGEIPLRLQNQIESEQKAIARIEAELNELEK